MTGNPDIRGVISPVELSEGFVDGGHYYIYKDKLNFHKLGNLLYLHISLLLYYHQLPFRRKEARRDIERQPTPAQFVSFAGSFQPLHGVGTFHVRVTSRETDVLG